MKWSALLALVAALALAAGLATSATAADTSGVATAAQKAKKKGKAKAKCPAKKKGKARKSDAVAAAKKKAAKKKAACKPKAKKKPKKKASPKPGGPIVPDGTYKDAANNVTIVVSANGTKAQALFPPAKCAGGMRLQFSGDIDSSGAKALVQREDSIFGGSGKLKWQLAIAANLRYSLAADWQVQFPDQGPCNDKVGVNGLLAR